MLRAIDELADIDSGKGAAAFLDRISFIFLILMALSAPHSIAATQTAWLIGMLAWIIRLFIIPRPKLFKGPLDFALWGFFFWSVISSIFSYAPDISIDKLRGASLFLVFYFALNNLKTKRAVTLISGLLIASCMVSVLWTPIERIFGRGIEIHGVKQGGPLAKALLIDGDTILKINKKKVSKPDEFLLEIEKNEVNKVEFYRPDFNLVIEVKRADLLAGDTLQRLGIESWRHSRTWRSAGFYGHYTTFAEVLQLIASLAFGVLIGLFHRSGFKFENPKLFWLLVFCLGFMGLALLLTATRASQLAFLLSAFVIVFFSGNRRILLALAAIILPVAIGGLIYLQASRNVGFFDRQDNSITWRETVYREGFDLARKNIRHLAIGVGMDSIKRYAGEWHLFDDGRLPMGHFHSTPLQLAVERGIPSLVLWLAIFWIYLSALKRKLKEDLSIYERGILLGCLGGAVGFFTSGLVHYNLGDAEVAMVFFLLMGTSFALIRLSAARSAQA